MYCVVVGDIVDSRGIDPDTDIRKRVTEAIQNAFDRINTDHIGSLMAPFGMVRGDAFEGVMLTQYHAPQIIQDIIKAVYSVEKTTIRISVALGHLTVTSEDRNKTDGPAFHTAFANLEKLKKRESTHWLQVSFDIGSLAQSLVDSHLALMTALTEGWTDKQREIVWAMEKYGSMQKVVGKQLGISPSVVNKQLKAANYEAYRQAWEGLTDYLINMDAYTIEDKPVVEKSYVPYFNMGVTAFELERDYAVALALFQKALEIAKSELEKNDPLLIPIYNKLARVSYLIKEYENAERFVNESIHLQDRMSKTRMQYAETLLIKAEICTAIGDYAAAKRFFQNAVDVARHIFGDAHDFVGNIYDSFADMYIRMEEYEEALKYYDMNLTMNMNADEILPLNYAITLSNIAYCHHKAKNYEQALHWAKEALSLYETMLLPSPKYTDHLHVFISNIKKDMEDAR